MPRRNTGFPASLWPHVISNQHAALFYVRVHLKTPNLMHRLDSLTSNSRLTARKLTPDLDKPPTHTFSPQDASRPSGLKNSRKHVGTTLGRHVNQQSHSQKHKNTKTWHQTPLTKDTCSKCEPSKDSRASPHPTSALKLHRATQMSSLCKGLGNATGLIGGTDPG